MRVVRTRTAPYRLLDMTANHGRRSLWTVAVMAACYLTAFALIVNFFPLHFGFRGEASSWKDRFDAPAFVLAIAISYFMVSLLAWGSLRIAWFAAVPAGLLSGWQRVTFAAVVGAIVFASIASAMLFVGRGISDLYLSRPVP